MLCNQVLDHVITSKSLLTCVCVGLKKINNAFLFSEIDWLVKPLSQFSRGEEVSTGAHGVDFGTPENVSPPFPGPMYQAGHLSHYEGSVENGAYESETEEQGLPPPPPPPPPPMRGGSAGQGFISQPQPEYGRLGVYPSYYDYMFLTGQYPPGTVSHASSSYEHGRDSWQDVHYVRDYAPYNPGPAQQHFEAPRQPVKSPLAGYRQGGAQPFLPAPYSTNAMQSGWFEAPTHSQAGGYNAGKVC